jgi:hypothetical protein
MNTSRLLRLYRNLIDSLSFSPQLRKMRRELNAKIDMPESIAPTPHSHPLGVNRWFKKRRISIAESYLMVVRDLDSKLSLSRIEALKALAAVSLNPKSLSMPLNTARVQMALIKEVVKHRYDKRRQLELLDDFSLSTSAQRQVIARLCDELNIIELPESGIRLCDFDYGWDSHVHDTATFGRKNPTQLVIDAFIKGISELTVAYGSIADMDKMEESIQAGSILGIRVGLALEFSAYSSGYRFHFLARLPRFETPAELRTFFEDNKAGLGAFFDGLETNRKLRTDSVMSVMEEFNAKRLQHLNEGFPERGMYRLEKLEFDGLIQAFPTLSVNRVHLSEYLYEKYIPVLRNRVMLYKLLRADVRHRRALALASKKDSMAVEERYSTLKKELKEISPEHLLDLYFSSSEVMEYGTVFEDFNSLAKTLKRAGCSTVFITPLEHGLEPALRVLEECKDVLDCVEVYNTLDAMGRDPKELLAFAHHVNMVNKELTEKGQLPCIPVCGSDATGRNPKIPGMGFVFEDTITGKRRRKYIDRHLPLPAFISALVASKGKPMDEAAVTGTNIYSMGKIAGDSLYMKGSGTEETGKTRFISPANAWRHANPILKEWIYAGIGFSVAAVFIGPAYALLWLAITGFRNGIADLVASKGSKLSEWKLKSINFDNVAQSLFWTGFSVPILGLVKSGFDLAWPWTQDGILFNLIKFFFISFANGLYLAAHNTLRGFERVVIRANFFRSIIAWPFATAFAPIGNLLGIPSIVQAKVWSDFVAGFIEGSGKFRKILSIRRKSVYEILPAIFAGSGEEKCISILDLLYLFNQEPRTQSTLRAVLDPPRTHKVLLGKELTAGQPALLGSLQAVLGQEGLASQLADYILFNYEEEMAADLVDLVSESLPELLDWLEVLGQKKKARETLPEERGGSA